MRRTEPYMLVLDKKVWRCPDCQNVVERPREGIYEENKAIENICEKTVKSAMSRGEEYLNNQDNIITEKWDPPQN